MADLETAVFGEGWFGDVRRQLAIVTQAEDFAATDRSRRLLRYLVEECLAGRADGLNQYTIAQDVFGRGKNFDPQVDPVVRTEASKLRRTLEHYYALGGAKDKIRFELPKGAYTIHFHRKDRSAASSPKMPRRVVDAGPRLAVAPLLTESREDAELFAIGMTHKLIAALSRFEGLEVVGHHKSHMLDQEGAAIRSQAQDFGLDLVLEGTLRWQGDRMRLTLGLTETDDFTTLWGETYDRVWAPELAFDIEDEISADVVAKIANRYGVIAGFYKGPNAAERVRTGGVYNAAMTFSQYNLNHQTFEATRSVLREAAAKDEDSALVLAMLTELEVDAVVLQLSDDVIELQAAAEMAERAARLDPNCQQAQQTLGYARMHCGAHDSAIRAYDRCISLNPNAAYLVAFSGWGMALCGAWDAGLAHLARAKLLNPMQPGWLNLAPLVHKWRAGDFEAAHALAQEFNSPGLAWDPALRAITAQRIGLTKEARVATEELESDFPGFLDTARDYFGNFIFDVVTVDDMLTQLSAALPPTPRAVEKSLR